jgi:integrase/recombinase XerD
MEVAHYSDHTVRVHGIHVELFVDWCEERSLHQPEEVTMPVIERYQRYLFHYRQKKNGKPLTRHSQHSRLVSVRLFFRWLARTRRIPWNPAADLELPRLGPKTLPKQVLTAAEAELVMAQPDLEDPIGLRDRAMMETFYSTGIRRGELAKLKLSNVDVAKGTLIILQGKGKKDRVVPIGERAIAWIEKYVNEVRPLLAVEPDDGSLFLGAMGNSITPEGISQAMHRHVKGADIGKTGSCHLFRHTAATLMLENGADLRYIQEMLGHSSVETTQIYTRVSIKKLKQIHDATHPGARLKRHRSEEAQQDLAKPHEPIVDDAAQEGTYRRNQIWARKKSKTDEDAERS